MIKYKKIINLLGNSLNQPFKFRTRKTFLQKNDESRGTYSTNTHIKFQAWMLKSSLCDYTDGYTFVSGTITTPNTRTPNNRKNITIKNCTLFTNCIS